jgi:hypothetical protein
MSIAYNSPSRDSRGYDFTTSPIAPSTSLPNGLLLVKNDNLLVFKSIGVNGDFAIRAKLSSEATWTTLFASTGTTSVEFDISRFDLVTIDAVTALTVGVIISSSFSVESGSLLQVSGPAGDATAANQVTTNNLLSTIETNQDTQTTILNTIASNTSGSPVADIVLVDKTSIANIIYVGEAAPGSSAASAVWKITRINKTGATTTILFADGNTNKDNVWNDRLSGSYS